MLANGVVCENGVTAEWDNTNWGLINVNPGENSKIKCSIDFKDLSKKLDDGVKLGDYIEMVPTAESYELPSDIMGSGKIINPSELSLWRVIKINEDKTIEIVSENISSNAINFSYKNAYLKYVGALNLFAKQYENEKYTIGSRHMGYNGQTEFIDSNNFNDKHPASLTTDTSKHGNQYESIGGGDTLYQTDIDLVQNVLETRVAKKQGTTEAGNYCIASRSYHYYSASLSQSQWSGRYISPNGSLYTDIIYRTISDGDSDNSSDGLTCSIRPILILKSGLKVLGSGTSEDHYKVVD